MMIFPLTLSHLLERANDLYGSVEIVSRMPDRSLHRYTYADFYRRARMLAGALEKAGLKKGIVSAALMWNHYVHLEAYLGVPVAGAGFAHAEFAPSSHGSCLYHPACGGPVSDRR